MANDKTTMGLDNTIVAKHDWKMSAKRVEADIRSDFVYAPHLQYIFRYASAEVADAVKSELAGGTFSPKSPIHIEVPKPTRMRKSGTQRRGPNFSRQGSILMPKDRLLYQAIGDMIEAKVEAKIDRKRCFSNRLSPLEKQVFVPTRNTWSDFQTASQTKAAKAKFIIKADVANFFGSLNQHTLVNLVEDAGVNASVKNLLEKILVRYTGVERSSRGILQGLSTSDLLGNFYLSPVDNFCKKSGVPSTRYVDDFHLFFVSSSDADTFSRRLIARLRTYDLSLNEFKTTFMVASNLLTEEPDLEILFNNAVDEISDWFDDDLQQTAGYNFQIDWDDDEDEDEDDIDIELEATKKLFNEISEYPGHSEKIERFCLPLFKRAGSDYAVDYVLDNLPTFPSMTQLYCVYLSAFLDRDEVKDALVDFLTENHLFDWQAMWAIATLLKGKVKSADAVDRCFELFFDTSQEETVRAVAVFYVGRYGNYEQKKEITEFYPKSGSEYLKSAVYFASRLMGGNLRSNMRKAHGADNEINIWIDTAGENAKVKSPKK